MSRTHLTNNAVALGAYVSLAVVGKFLLLFVFYWLPPAANFSCITGIGEVSAMVLCAIVIGFFLEPVEKFSFLSVIFIPAVLTGPVILPFAVPQAGALAGFFFGPHIGELTLMLNPLSVLMRSLTPGDFPFLLFCVLLFASSVVPALLMCVGIMLRKRLMS